MRSLTDVYDLSVEETKELCEKALDIINAPEKYRDACKYKKLAAVFFEPSTRTRLSFEAAMLDLGGSVLSVSDEKSSSAAKGESLSDTARMLSLYADVIAMRHPREGAAIVAANAASVPIITAGDGGHAHPTQTLTDLLTIYREKGKLEGLKIGVCGDLLYGRTAHSLIRAMSRYEGVSFVLISPRELRLPDYIRRDVSCVETESLDEALPQLDVLYMTRIQRERFRDAQSYERLKDSYILTESKMRRAKKDCIIMHPLPRVNEISVDVDRDPRAAYFRQAGNGKFIRMALILKLLGDSSEKKELHGEKGAFICKNSRCITRTEQELPREYKTDAHGVLRCFYCDAEIK